MTGMEIVELDWRIRIGGMRLADCFAIRLFCVVGSGSVAEWTLRRRGGTRKSKTQVGEPKRKTRHHICEKNYIKSHKPLALKLTSSRIIQVSNNLHFYERRGVIIMKFMDKDDFEKQNVFGTGQANTAYAKYFIGDSFLNPLTDSKCGLLSRDAVITGISIMQQRAADRCLYVQLERAGIRKRARSL